MTLELSFRNESAADRVRSLKSMRSLDKILVHEIFTSIQGESSFAGLPCVFIRSAVCHLRCSYCDTAHAFHDGKEMSIEEIVNTVLEQNVSLVEITGGEPLLQPRNLPLMSALCDKGLTVLLETSGAVSIQKVDKRVHIILDVKTPGSGEESRNIVSNFNHLSQKCEVKFVICDRKDFDFAKEMTFKHELHKKCTVLFSPEASHMNPTLLAEWIVQERLPVRFQIQLHKILWGDKTGV